MIVENVHISPEDPRELISTKFAIAGLATDLFTTTFFWQST